MKSEVERQWKIMSQVYDHVSETNSRFHNFYKLIKIYPDSYQTNYWTNMWKTIKEKMFDRKKNKSNGL